MKVNRHSPGLIIDNETSDLHWMIYSPYNDARNRMSQDTVETMLMEFIEMMWSVDVDLGSLEVMLKTKYSIQMDRQRGSIEYSVNPEYSKYLKRFSVLLDEQREYIQVLTLFICDQPDVSMLKQRLAEISPEFIINQNESNLYIQWQSKQVTINVEL